MPPAFSSLRFALACSFVAFLYYSFLITNGRLGIYELFAPVGLGMTFNSMLQHLLMGRFDVDAAAIGAEAFIKDGKSYTYFGILPAILRLPLWVTGKLRAVDMTVLSCVLAATVAVFFKASTLGMLHKVSSSRSSRPWIVVGAVAIVFSGPQLQFLRPTIYQEVVSWAAAFGAAYVFCALYGLIVRRDFPLSLLVIMSTLAGLVLMTRFLTGFGFYLSTGLLLLVLAWRQAVAGKPPASQIPARIAAFLTRGRMMLPIAVLLLFLVLAGTVNYERWGNPTLFLDLSLNVRWQDPGRIPRLTEYGTLNLHRIGFGLSYYLFPIWAVVRSDGKFLFHEFQTRMVDTAEFPPSSLFLSDPLTIALSGVFLTLMVRWRRLRLVDPLAVSAIVAGTILPIGATCAAIYYAFRYRSEFYPFLDLTGFLGLFFLLDNPERWFRRRSAVLTALFVVLLVQIGASHVLLVLYKLSLFGNTDPGMLTSGLIAYYWSALESMLR